MQNTNRRLTPPIIDQDINSFHGLETITDYQTSRDDASKSKIDASYEAMLNAQKAELRN